VTVETVERRRSKPDGAVIFWDVIEEHLDEAEFMFERWLAAARSPRLSLADLRRSGEERLVAHLDGLAEGGRAVAEKLLWPALAEDAGAPAVRVSAAALALLADPDPAVRDRLVAALGAAEGAPLRDGLKQAFQVTERNDVDEPLRLALYATTTAAAQSALLEVLAARRVDPGPILGTLLASEEPAVLREALAAAAGATDAARHRSLVETHLGHELPAVRAAAMRTGLVWNLSSAWRTCSSEARAGAPEAMLPLAFLGGPKEIALLADAARMVERRQAAIFALGFSGSVEAVATCLPALDDPDPIAASLAAEAIAAIAGLPLYQKPFVLPPKDEDDGDGELAPSSASAPDIVASVSHEELPCPNAESIRAWWSERRSAFLPDRRYLRGTPLSVAAVEAALEQGPLRRSGPLAHEVAVRSAGRLQLPALHLAYPEPRLSNDVALFRQPRWC
jgi:uncharacterized protein (TIGR02270 family)